MTTTSLTLSTVREGDPGPSYAPVTSLPVEHDKRLMLFAGRANPELATS